MAGTKVSLVTLIAITGSNRQKVAGSYRGNRQQPLASHNKVQYDAYEARLKQLRGGSCP